MKKKSILELDSTLDEILSRNPEWETKLINKIMIEYWGEPCPDFDPDCASCLAWKNYKETGEIHG